MICRILLLINLTSPACGVFEPRNMALTYQAEEKTNLTVEWRFSSKADISIPSLKIHCVFVVPELKVFYHLDNSVEESQHEQFAGRVQCDKDALRTGSVRLHLSGVRADDSGLYLCRMATEFGKKVKKFSLNITDLCNFFTAARDWPEFKRPNIPSRGRIGLYWGLTAAAAAGLCWLLVTFYSFTYCRSNNICSPEVDLRKVTALHLDQRKPFEQQYKFDNFS